MSDQFCLDASLDDDGNPDEPGFYWVCGVEYGEGDKGPDELWIELSQEDIDEERGIVEVLSDSYPAIFSGYDELEPINDPDEIAALPPEYDFLIDYGDGRGLVAARG